MLLKFASKCFTDFSAESCRATSLDSPRRDDTVESESEARDPAAVDWCPVEVFDPSGSVRAHRGKKTKLGGNR